MQPFCTLGGNAEWRSHCGKKNGDTSKNLKWIYLLTQRSHFWEFIQRNPPKKLIQKNISSPMFIAALFTIAKIWKQPNVPSVDEWIIQLWDTYTMEYHLSVKKKKILPFVTVWMDLEKIMLSGISHSEKDHSIYHMISLVCEI